VMSNSKKDFAIRELKALLEDAYDIGKIMQIEAISCDEEELLGGPGAMPGGSSAAEGTPSVTSFRVSANQGEYFLKRVGEWISDERLIAIADFIRWTEARSYVLSPSLKTSDLCSTYVQVSGDRFQLFDFLPQKKRQIWMRAHLSEDECALAGDLLGRMHLASAEYLSENEARKVAHSNAIDWNACCEALFERIKSEGASAHPVLLNVAKNEEYLKAKFVSAIQLMSSQGKNAVPLLVHGDFHPGNVLFLENKTDSSSVRLVDFDYLRLDHPFFDVGYAFLMFAQVLSFGKSQHLERSSDQPVDWRFGRAFLRGYYKALHENPTEKLKCQIRKAEIMAACLHPRTFLQYTTFACFLILEWAIEKLINGSTHFSPIYLDVIETVEKLVCYELGEAVVRNWEEAIIQ
jgi:Ser/Thr protein kinase RdoA (MazF antagonist)